MLSDLQLVYMGPRNSTELLKINTTKFQVEREPVYNCSMFSKISPVAKYPIASCIMFYIKNMFYIKIC